MIVGVITQGVSQNKWGDVNRFLKRAMLFALMGGLLFISPKIKPPIIVQDSFKTITAEMPVLLSGDLVFRRCNGLTSQFVDVVDAFGDFSHVGIVWISSSGEIFVVHALPGEDDAEGYVQITPLLEFVGHQEVQSYATFRVFQDFEREAHEASEWAYSLVDQVKFDSSFDLKTDNEQYCTELIWKAYLHAGLDLTSNSFDEFDAPIFGTNVYIFPSRLLNNAYVYQVFP